jgi:hypothetical protein
VYKKLASNKDVHYYKNKTLHEIFLNKNKILDSLDNTFKKYIDKHQHNKYFIKIYLEHSLKRQILSENINQIDQYLKSGHTLIYVNLTEKEIKITSSRKNRLLINLDGKTYYHDPEEFYYQAKIKREIKELRISDFEKAEITIKDMLTNKFLESEKDYNIIYIN